MRKFKHIAIELRHHLPFTAFGAFAGIIIMSIICLAKITFPLEAIFHILHPFHILLSAFVTTSMYRRYKKGIFTSLFIGFIGSVGICSLSDIILPFFGGLLLRLKIYWHLCLIEHPYIIIFPAVIGSLIGYKRPTTECPHTMHILISTGASLFYLLGFGLANWLKFLPPIFLLLFFAVWLPCCTSDIVFPLLFVKPEGV